MATLEKEGSKDLSIIIVNFESERYLPGCISSVLRNFSETDYEIIIVNNDSKAQLTDIIARFPEVKIITSENNGFGRAVNLGAKFAKGGILLLLNPDTELIAGDFEQIKAILNEENTWIMGCGLLTPQGRPQEWNCGAEVNFFNLACNNLGLVKSKAYWQAATKREVDWVSGAGLAIKREKFLSLSGFDEKIFMYFEDVDLCKRVRELGHKVIFYPQFQIKHFGGASFGDKNIQKKWYFESQRYYFMKHFGQFKATLVDLLRKLFA